MAKVKIQPLGDRVLVKQIEEKEQIRGGIIIPDAAKKVPFEEAKEKIEQIIRNMESGDLPLEESVAQFEEASSLIKYCQQKLDEYKGKVEAITIAEERKGENE